MDDVVMAARFLRAEEAEVGQGLLQSEGIESFVADDLLQNIHPGLTGASGGIRILVHQKDLERAQKLLADVEGALALPDDFIPPPEEAPPPEASGLWLDYLFAFLKGGFLAVAALLALAVAFILLSLVFVMTGAGWIFIFLLGGLIGLFCLKAPRRPM